MPCGDALAPRAVSRVDTDETYGLTNGELVPLPFDAPAAWEYLVDFLAGVRVLRFTSGGAISGKQMVWAGGGPARAGHRAPVATRLVQATSVPRWSERDLVTGGAWRGLWSYDVVFVRPAGTYLVAQATVVMFIAILVANDQLGIVLGDTYTEK